MDAVLNVFQGIKNKTLDESTLISRAQSGDKEAFSVLMKGTLSAMLGIAYAFTKNKAKAEDIVQEAYLKAYRALPNYRGESSFKSWLSRIVINCCKNSIRAKKDQDHDNIDDHFEIADSSKAELDEKEELESNIDILKKGIDTLPNRQRMILEMKVYQEMELKDIADKIDSPYDTVKANYRHGIFKLKKHFEKFRKENLHEEV